MSNIPFLGSKISLISKSEIRYEGILYTIDTKESTVALAKVRSFGTEDRPTERPLAPRAEVYEYIIFRASDIKELDVCDSLPHDPAIVKHSQPVSFSSASFAQPFSLGIPSFQHFPSQSSYAAIPPILTPDHYSGTSRSAAQSQKKNLTADAGIQVSVFQISSDRSRGVKNDTREPLRPRNREQSQSNMQSRRRMPSQNRQQNNRRSLSRRGRRPSAPSIERFENEYDFEQANAEFQELENKLSKSTIEDSNTESVAKPEEAPGAYNKDKSFFDDISCEATQRSKGLPRFDWRHEQKLNVETFGVLANNIWLRRRRARGGFRRGYRGRGSFNRPTEVPAQKTVTFDETPVIKEVEIVTLEEQPDPIPVIEVIVDKEKTDWPETSTKQEIWD